MFKLNRAMVRTDTGDLSIPVLLSEAQGNWV